MSAVQGTTTNGRYMLPFRTGAFVAGVPVQPILIHYPAVRNRPSLAWETIGAMTHAWLVLSGFLQSSCIIELPLYSPSEEEQSNALLYAANVRRYMVRTAPLSLLHNNGATVATPSIVPVQVLYQTQVPNKGTLQTQQIRAISVMLGAAVVLKVRGGQALVLLSAHISHCICLPA